MGVGKPTTRGGWTYPMGSKVIPDIMFDWLPDFSRLYFSEQYSEQIAVSVGLVPF